MGCQHAYWEIMYRFTFKAGLSWLDSPILEAVMGSGMFLDCGKDCEKGFLMGVCEGESQPNAYSC